MLMYPLLTMTIPIAAFSGKHPGVLEEVKLCKRSHLPYGLSYVYLTTNYPHRENQQMLSRPTPLRPVTIFSPTHLFSDARSEGSTAL